MADKEKAGGKADKDFGGVVFHNIFELLIEDFGLMDDVGVCDE